MEAVHHVSDVEAALSQSSKSVLCIGDIFHKILLIIFDNYIIHSVCNLTEVES